MMLKFDHLVHYTASPYEASIEFQNLGFQVIKGGNHQNWGTYNSLSYFPGIRYIEWIGINNMTKASKSDNPLIQQIVADSFIGEGFSQIAFRTTDTTDLAHKLAEKGFSTIGPLHGERVREDGTLLQWSMLFINDKNVRYPFFIQWGQGDDIREREMKQLMEHANGKPNLSTVSYEVKNAKELAEKYCDLLNIERMKVLDSHIELNVNEFSIRFYESTDTSNRPVRCGITGVKEEYTDKISGGYYQFLSV